MDDDFERLLVGHSDAPSPACLTGSAEVFDLRGRAPTPSAFALPRDEENWHGLGRAVALTALGKRVFIAAPGTLGLEGTGRAHVFGPHRVPRCPPGAFEERGPGGSSSVPLTDRSPRLRGRTAARG